MSFTKRRRAIVKLGRAAGIERKFYRLRAWHVSRRFSLRAKEAALLSETTAAEQLVRPRLLIVEDNRVNREVLARLLETAGYAIDAVPSGVEALEAAARTDYAVILMDCKMPGMDGFQTTAALRLREGSGRHAVVIAMTADSDDAAREACLAAGMDDYVSKPFTLRGMVSTLERWLGPKRI